MWRAVIVTLLKPNKDPTSSTHYRPISLLNTDVKLFAKLLALRLQKILPHLILPRPSGICPSHQAPDGSRRLINLISQAGPSQEPSLLLSFDGEKGEKWVQSSGDILR